MNLADVIKKVEDSVLFGDAESPMANRLHMLSDDGPVESNLCLVLGGNAAGKSLLRRLIQSLCQHEKVRVLHLSMEKRCGGSFGAIERTLIYGAEDEDSTGTNSATTVLTSIRTSKEWEDPHVIFYDEPDVGLSDEYAAGCAEAMADYFAAPSPKLVGAFVVSHRREMMKRFERTNPRVLFVGPKDNAPASLKAWLERDIKAANPSDLKEEAITRWREVGKFLRERRKP